MYTRFIIYTFLIALSIVAVSCSSPDSGSDDGESPPCLLEKTGQYPLSGYSFNFDVSGDFAVISNRPDHDSSDARLYVVNISDRKSPAFFASMDISNDAPGIVISGTSAYVSRLSYNDGWETLLQQIDLSSSALTVLQEVTSDGFVSDLSMAGGNLYLLTGERLSVIDSGDIESTVSYYDAYMSSAKLFVDSSAQRAYVSGQERVLDIFDISDDANLVLLDPGSVDNPYAGSGGPSSIIVKNDIVVLPWGNNGVISLDISDLNDIQLHEIYETGDSAHAIIFHGDYALLADGDEGIQIMDVSDFQNPVRVGQCKTSGSSWDLKLIGDDLFVLDRDLGLEIYDMSGM